LCFVVLFDGMSDNLEILCLHSGIIINTDNDITYNEGSYEFITATLNMSLNELSKMLYDRLGWNVFETEVEITWRMLQIDVSQAHYVGVPICSNESLNSMFGFVRNNKINMLELYLNSRPKRENSYSMELKYVWNKSWNYLEDVANRCQSSSLCRCTNLK
jgi:hypothetical protein